MGAFGVIMLIGCFGTSTVYWLARGRYESFVLGRAKTTFAFFFWYLFIPYWAFSQWRAQNR